MAKSNSIMLRSILRKTGMKATPGHLAILSFIQKSKKPLSTQDVILGIGKNLHPATVYRCMAKLKNNGVIRQFDLRRNHAQYEFFDMAHHHHIICFECGKIEDITHCNLESVHRQIVRKARHFTQVRHSLEFYGLCKSCVSQRKK